MYVRNTRTNLNVARGIVICRISFSFSLFVQLRISALGRRRDTQATARQIPPLLLAIAACRCVARSLNQQSSRASSTPSIRTGQQKVFCACIKLFFAVMHPGINARRRVVFSDICKAVEDEYSTAGHTVSGVAPFARRQQRSFRSLATGTYRISHLNSNLPSLNIDCASGRRLRTIRLGRPGLAGWAPHSRWK